MTSLFRNKHFISCESWSKQELNTVFEVAADLKRRFALNEAHRLLQDSTLFMMFFEQSTRTRNAMEAGMTQLGGHAHDLTPDKMQLSHGESAKDTAIILSRMGHGIACRNCFYGIGNAYLNELAEHATVPVMSLQDDIYHPMQGIADVMTLFEHFGSNLQGLNVTISWAYAQSHAKPLSVPQSQMLLFPRYGMNVTIAHPNEFPLSTRLVSQAQDNARAGGGSLRFSNDMDAALEGAHVVIPKNWGGFGLFEPTEYLENEAEAQLEMQSHLAHYQDWIFNRERVALADDNVKLMHALPADRNREVSDDVIDDPSISIVYDEAENRLHTAKAMMALSMGGR